VNRAAIAALVLAAGCDRVLGLDELHRADAGAEAVLDAEIAPANTVVGSSTVRYATAGGDVEQVEDLRPWQFQALVPDDAEPTGFRVVAGAGTSDGRFTIDGVPDGATYYLKIVQPGAQGASYFVLDEHVIRLDRWLGGRPDAEPVSAAQPVDLELAGIQPWQRGDTIAIDVFNTATEAWLIADAMLTPPAPGETSVGTRIDWGCLFCYSARPDRRPALVDAARGDVVELAHVRAVPRLDNAGRRMQSGEVTIGRATAADVTMTSGSASTITAAFAPLTLDRSARVTFNRAQFDAGHDPQSRLQWSQVLAWASPIADRGLLLGPPLFAVMFGDWSGAGPLSSTVDLTYGDPYPAAMPRVMYQSYSRQRGYRLPGRSPRWLSFGYRRLEPLVLPVPAAPAILPPGNVRIDGLDAAAGGRVEFDGQRPVRLSWTAVQAAGAYTVTAIRVSSSGNLTDLTTVATFTTWQPALDLPAEVFGGGEFFAFRITAHRGDVSPTWLLRFRGEETWAQTVTGMFRFSATCGDGDVDPGEECDTGGPSAACDVDCTPAECGDGLVNVLAGEVCDTVSDTVSCDRDCTLPRCGDGLWNPQVEDCDDGNQIDDGNGCSASCRANNVCGDGVVQAAVEECDDGNRSDDGNGCDERCRFN
jgi:cysteine-rich repeat protein